MARTPFATPGEPSPPTYVVFSYVASSAVQAASRNNCSLPHNSTLLTEADHEATACENKNSVRRPKLLTVKESATPQARDHTATSALISV